MHLQDQLKPERAAEPGKFVVWTLDQSRRPTRIRQFDDRETAVAAAEELIAELFPDLLRVLVYDDTGAYVYMRQRQLPPARSSI